MEKTAKERTDVLCVDECLYGQNTAQQIYFFIVFHAFGCFGLCYGPEDCILRSMPFTHLHQRKNNDGEMAISNGVSIEYETEKNSINTRTSS